MKILVFLVICMLFNSSTLPKPVKNTLTVGSQFINDGWEIQDDNGNEVYYVKDSIWVMVVNDTIVSVDVNGVEVK